MIFFTSDTHFGHARIIELCNRPFASVEQMNEEIIRRWNEIVMPWDEVYHLGDVALGKIDDSLPVVSRLNGYKTLVSGNHDRPFMNRNKARYDEWHDRYSEVFEEVSHFSVRPLVLSSGHEVMLSHFPYTGDSNGEDRYVDERPEDNGMILLHGHTHLNQRISRSDNNSLQIHVGMDAWDYRPVSETRIISLINKNKV